MRLTAGGPEERRETIRKKKMFRHIFHLMAVCMAAVVLLLSTFTYSMVKKAVAGQNIETAMHLFPSFPFPHHPGNKQICSCSTSSQLHRFYHIICIETNRYEPCRFIKIFVKN